MLTRFYRQDDARLESSFQKKFKQFMGCAATGYHGCANPYSAIMNQHSDDKQIYTSADELLVFGWIRRETKDNIPKELMKECLNRHRNNKWIRPDIQCWKMYEQSRDLLTKAQEEWVTRAILYSYEQNQSLAELMDNTRDRLKEYGIKSLVTETVNAKWLYMGYFDQFTLSNWSVNNHDIYIWCTNYRWLRCSATKASSLGLLQKISECFCNNMSIFDLD